MSDIYDTLFVQRGAEEAFQIAADDARKLRSRLVALVEVIQSKPNKFGPHYMMWEEKLSAALDKATAL